jgi:UPF0176 protein
MQLYNTLSAEEPSWLMTRKQRLTLSFYAYAQIKTLFRNDLFLAWNPLEVLGRIYVANGESTPNCPFLLIILRFQGQYWSICFHERNPIEYCNRARRSFLLKLTIKVRDKIVADGLVDKTFDVTNIGIHLKAKNSTNY